MPNVYMKPYLILNQARRFLNTVYKMTWVYIVGSIKKLMGALTVFYYLRSHIDWPITQFLKKHRAIPNRSSPFAQLPQNRSMIMLHLGPTPPQFIYRHEGRTVSTQYAIKLRCYWEQLGEPGKQIANLVRTFWEQTRSNLKPPQTLK